MQKKWTLLSIGLAILIGGGIWARGYLFHEEDVQSGSSDIVTLSPENYVNAIRVTGTARLAHEQKLRFLQGGKVEKVSVKAGSPVKKGDILATLDMAEFKEVYIQARDRLELTRSKLDTARAKIGGLEGEKQRAELIALESKKRSAEDDLQKLIKSAPQKSLTKQLELDAKRADLTNKEAVYKIDNELYEKELANRSTLLTKKTSEARKVIDTIFQNAQTDYSDDLVIHNGINKIFGFDSSTLTSDDRIKAENVGWNVGGSVNDTRAAWTDMRIPLQDLRAYIDSLSGKQPTSAGASTVIDMFISLENRLLDTIDRAKKTLDLTQPRDIYLSMSDIDSMRTTLAGYRTTLINRINTRKENKNALPLIASDTLIAAQVDKELAEKKQSLINTQIAIEKLRTDILESEPLRTRTGVLVHKTQIDSSIQRDIDSKRQEILDLSVQIASKKVDIDKLSRGKTDEIVSLESDLKSAQSELNKALTRKSQYELRAPIDGMIRSVKMMEGDNLSSSSTTGNDGTITIEDNNAVLVITKLGQKDIVRVRQGTEAEIRLDTFPDIVFTGTVIEMSSSPDEGGGGGESLYETRILFDRGDKPVYSGMSANVMINLSSRENILFVPLSAVKTDPTTQERSVIVVQDGKEEHRVITVGVPDGDRVEVLSGVVSGERVKVMNFDPTQYKDPNQMGGPMGI